MLYRDRFSALRWLKHKSNSFTECLIILLLDEGISTKHIPPYAKKISKWTLGLNGTQDCVNEQAFI